MFYWILAMGAPSGEGGGGGYGFLIMMALLFAVMYFLLIRPQQKRQKQQQQMIAQLKKGDQVVTSGGMIGTVVGFGEQENVIVLKFGDNTKIEFLKSAIAAKADQQTGQ